MPGCISVPYDFTVDEMKTFVEENIQECRIKANEFVESERTMLKVNAALARHRGPQPEAQRSEAEAAK